MLIPVSERHEKQRGIKKDRFGVIRISSGKDSFRIDLLIAMPAAILIGFIGHALQGDLTLLGRYHWQALPS